MSDQYDTGDETQYDTREGEWLRLGEAADLHFQEVDEAGDDIPIMTSPEFKTVSMKLTPEQSAKIWKALARVLPAGIADWTMILNLNLQGLYAPVKEVLGYWYSIESDAQFVLVELTDGSQAAYALNYVGIVPSKAISGEGGGGDG